MNRRYPYSMSDNRGFTLLENLLVITIVGLLLSFSVTAWQTIKSSQQISSTVTLLKTASQCLESYVIHSERIPPASYFIAHCSRLDPWGNAILYENNGDNQEVANVISKTLKDKSGDHPDAAWIVTSFGPDRTRNVLSSATLWDCSTGDDLCRATSKNGLFYEINR